MIDAVVIRNGFEVSVQANIGLRGQWLCRNQNFESIHIGCGITRYAHEPAPQQAAEQRVVIRPMHLSSEIRQRIEYGEPQFKISAEAHIDCKVDVMPEPKFRVYT